jgi:hypothetical protein
MSSSSASGTGNPFGQKITEKLNRSNHALWKAQVRAAVRGARLEGHLTGATKAPPAEITVKGTDAKDIQVPNPEYEHWDATDQQVLSYLLTSVSKEILSNVASSATAADALELHREDVRLSNSCASCQHPPCPC